MNIKSEAFYILVSSICLGAAVAIIFPDVLSIQVVGMVIVTNIFAEHKLRRVLKNRRNSEEKIISK